MVKLDINKHPGIYLARAVSAPVEKQTIEIAGSMYLSTLLTHFLVSERGSSENPPKQKKLSVYSKNVKSRR